MSKLTIAGMISWFFSVLLLGYHGLDILIRSQEKLVSKSLTLTDVFGHDHLVWINGMPEGIMHNAIQYIVNMPLYLLLFFVGILLIVLGRLTSKL